MSFIKEPSEELIMLVLALVVFPSDTDPQLFHSEPSQSLQQEEGVLLSTVLCSSIARDPFSSSTSSCASCTDGPHMYPNVGVGENGRGKEGDISPKVLRIKTHNHQVSFLISYTVCKMHNTV